MKQKNKQHIFALTASALMVALSVVLTRFLGFSAEGTPFRFEIGFLPIALLAYMLGPIYAGIGFLAADTIGSLLSGYAPNPWIAGCQLLAGVFMGIILYKKDTLIRNITCFSVLAVVIEILLKSPGLIWMYGWEWGYTLATRSLNALINLPIRILLFYISLRALKKPLAQFSKKSSFQDYANSFQAVTIPGLERISLLLKKLGDPHKRLRFVHVAGTNGKGSVCANISCILEDAGYNVGKYTSPNLISVNERIRINGEMIADDELNEILSRIEPLAAEVEQALSIPPTQFEIWTAAAFLYFAEKACDYVVLEVGLGGEFDATNVIEQNEIAIVTRLGIDHTGYLGNTIAEIAKAKAGIFKRSSTTNTVVTVAQESAAMDVLTQEAENKALSLLVASPTPIRIVDTREVFRIDDLEITCGMSGYHQIENAALAVLAARTLGISDAHIKSGILRAKHPARFEIICDDPMVIYDGAHNENGVTALVSSLDRYFGACKKVVIFAAMQDKEIDKSLALLSENDTEFIFTTVQDNPRALTAKALAEKAAGYGFHGDYYEDIKEAYAAALEKNILTVVCGSLYLYKDFFEYCFAN